MKELLIWLGLLSGPAVIFAVFGTSGMDAFDDRATPHTSSALMEQGRSAFARHCASSHGRLAGGTTSGPGLLGAPFGLSAMPDEAIRSAVLEGVPPRNDAYRPMGPSPEIAPGELDDIIAFLRELQRLQGVH